MMVVMPTVVLLGLLTTAIFHLVLDQQHHTSLTVDRALAKHDVEMALDTAEREPFVATETPAGLGYMTALPWEHITVLEPDSRRGFLVGVYGSGISLGLCQP